MSLGHLEHELQLLIKATRINEVTAYFEVASIAVLVYDYFLTLKLEVDLTWGTPWNIPKILFVSTRYSAFMDAGLLGYFHFAGDGPLSIKTCNIVYQISGWLIFLGAAVAEFVLVFRTWAIWGQSRKVAIGLLMFMFGVGIPSIYLAYLSMKSVRYIKSPVPHIQRCFLIRAQNRAIFLDYVGILTVETVILIFTALKGVRQYRYTKSSLVSTLYKDGLLYYVFLTTCSIANVFTLAFPNGNGGVSLILLERVFQSIFTARILLDLRLAGVQDRRAATTTSTPGVLTSLFILSREDQLSTSVLRADSQICVSETGGFDA